MGSPDLSPTGRAQILPYPKGVCAEPSKGREMLTPCHEKQPGGGEKKEKKAAMSPGYSLILVHPAVKTQRGASPLLGDPLAANPEAKEGVPCSVPKREETKGATCLVLLAGEALIQLPVFSGPGKSHALQKAPNPCHSTGTQGSRMLVLPVLLQQDQASRLQAPERCRSFFRQILRVMLQVMLHPGGTTTISSSPAATNCCLIAAKKLAHLESLKPIFSKKMTSYSLLVAEPFPPWQPLEKATSFLESRLPWSPV